MNGRLTLFVADGSSNCNHEKLSRASSILPGCSPEVRMNWKICLLFLICVRRHCRWRWKIGLTDQANCRDRAWLATLGLLLPFFAAVTGQADPSRLEFCHMTSSNVSIPDYFSPFYPDAYPNNTDCSKLLTAPPDHVIELDFRGHFHIEGRDCHELRNPFILRKPIECFCQYDFLEIRDGPYGYSPLIGRFCGRIYPPILRSTSRYMRLRFKSDDAIQFEGFYAFYKNVPFERKRNVWNATECHIFIEGREGLVNATSIPKRFVNDAQINGVPLDCIFEINVTNNSQILLRFSEIKLVNPKDCDMDFIDVHQTSLEVHDRVRQYCGGSAEDARINASKAFLRFMSDPTMLNDNNFNAYFTAIRPADDCDGDTEFDCGDGICIAKELLCDHRSNCLNRADEADCEPSFSWKKTTLQSVIISVVVGIIIIGVLAIAIYLTCNEKQISQPRRYFTPAPLQKAIMPDEFGYGCTVDEMLARSKEEQVGYFVRHVEGPIVDARIPSSRLVGSQSTSSSGDWPQNPRNGTIYKNHTNSLPLNPTSRSPRKIFGLTQKPSTSRSPAVVSGGAKSVIAHPAASSRVCEESYYVAGDDLDLHTSLRNGVPVFMYSPHTKRRLMRVA